MEVEQREIHDTIQKRLQQPSPHLDKSLLHLAVFFCLLQARTGTVRELVYSWLTSTQMMSSRGPKTILRALGVLDQVARLVVQPRGARGFSTRVDKSVLLLFRALEGLGCLMRDSSSIFTEAQWHKTLVDFKKLKSEVTAVDAHVALLFECHCTFLAAFTDINAQSSTWLDRESEYGAVPGSRNDAEPSYANHLAVGQKIIQQASELLESLQELEDAVKEIKSIYDTSYDMIMSTSLNFKISTLRLFAHPLWQNASVSKQALHESDILEYAHSNLEHLEKRMPHAGVEAFIYIDQLLVIGLEMRHSLDRLRVISLLDTIKSRGFGFAEVYIEDLQLAWKAL
ncbi:fungal specific transcription factor domain-containing protein [Colletotrichum tabaci]|uniref:Fungal specific transcription factor domain-containing protein n=1 Tax=Colletotrichum tabaci TaxID=1209068 RepID=A0AAV9TJY6_9PEZI